MEGNLICQYCNTDMEPISLDGKTFCSNCGLTTGNVDNSTTSKIFNFNDRDKETSQVDVIPADALAPVASPIIPSTPITDQARVDLGLSPAPTDDLIATDKEPSQVVAEPIAAANNNVHDAEDALDTTVTQNPSTTTTTPTDTKQVTTTVVEPVTPAPNTKEKSTNKSNPLSWFAKIPVKSDAPAVETPAVPEKQESTEIAAPEEEIPSTVKSGPDNETTDKNVPIILPDGSADIKPNDDQGDEIEESESQSPPILTEEPMDSQINNLEIPSESDFDIQPRTNLQQKKLKEEIKQVDALSASGILLDILSDQEKTNEQENKIDNLKAAETILEDMANNDFESNDDIRTYFKSGDTAEKTEPKNIFDAGVLTDQPQNPVEYPEFTETDNETPEKDDSALDSKTLKSKESIKDITPMTAEKQAAIDEHVKSIFTEDESKEIVDIYDKVDKAEEDKPEPLKKIMENIEEVTPKEIELSESEASDYDVDSLPSNIKVSTTKKPEILAEYFKTKLRLKKSLNSSENTISDKTDSKNTILDIFKSKKALMFIILFFMAIVIVAGLAYATIYYYNQENPKTQLKEATTKASFETKKPTYIIEGYTMSGSKNDSGTGIFTVEYIFNEDDQKTITYTQAKPKDTQVYLDSLLKKDGLSYVTKTVNENQYTEINGNTLVWTNNGFVFTIKAENYSLSTDLLYQMAQTVE